MRHAHRFKLVWETVVWNMRGHKSRRRLQVYRCRCGEPGFPVPA